MIPEIDHDHHLRKDQIPDSHIKSIKCCFGPELESDVAISHDAVTQVIWVCVLGTVQQILNLFYAMIFLISLGYIT